MNRAFYLGLILVLFGMACNEEPIQSPLSTVDPLVVEKYAICQNLSLKFRFEQILRTDQPNLNSLKIIITNISTNEVVSSTNPLSYCIHVFDNDQTQLEHLILLHEQTLDTLAINEIADTVISKNLSFLISDSKVQVDILECAGTQDTFSGVYVGDVLLPKFRDTTNRDTIPALARCLIDVEGKVKIWLEDFPDTTEFRPRTIEGDVTPSGLIAASAYDASNNLVSYMLPDSIAVQPPNNNGDFNFLLNFATPQIIYNADTCNNLIFDLKAI